MLSIDTEGRPLNLLINTVLLEADPKKHSVYKNDKVDLWLDTTINKHATENCTQDAIVRYAANKTDAGKEINLSDGDHVYTHHWLCGDGESDNRIEVNGEILYQLDYFHLYGIDRGEGEIEMLQDCNFVEPIMEDESNYKTKSGIYIKPNIERLQLRGKMKHVSQSAKAFGVKKGDTVVFTQVADYPMKVEGELLFRILTEDLLAIEE